MIEDKDASVPSSEPPSVKPVKKKRAPRGRINKKVARLLTAAEQIARAAGKPVRSAVLSEREITKQYLNELLKDIEAARSHTADTLQSTTEGKTATVSESKALRDLVVGLQSIQAAAKQKHFRHNRAVLADYCVGVKLTGNRANLEQMSKSIIKKAGEDRLPGIKAKKIAEVSALRDAWIDANTEQANERNATGTKRAELNEMLRSIDHRRLEIQLAADGEWTHTNVANHAIRLAFQLPKTRPLRV